MSAHRVLTTGPEEATLESRLIEAAAQGNDDAVKALLRLVDANAMDENAVDAGTTALMVAVQGNHVTTVKVLLRSVWFGRLSMVTMHRSIVAFCIHRQQTKGVVVPNRYTGL